MKKSLIIAVLAGAALAGCTIDERDSSVKNDNPQQITFTNPVLNPTLTRGEAVVGEIPKYPTNEEFFVYAKQYEGDFSAWSAGTDFTIGKVTYSSELGGWAPSEDKYWPKNGDKLAFAAYSPADLTTDCTVEYGATGLTLTGFTVRANGYTKAQVIDGTLTSVTGSKAENVQYDLMYSDRAVDKVAIDAGTTPYNGVTLLFHHALSSIVFTVKIDADYGTGAKFELKSIKLSGVNSKGKFTEGLADNGTVTSTAMKWEEQGTAAEYTVFDQETDLGLITNTEQSVIDLTKQTESSTSLEGKNLILLPQTFDGSSPAKITIVYQLTNNGIAKDVTVEKSLNDVKFDSDETAEWKIGKRYTYNIIFGLDKIYFNPTVEDWGVGGNKDVVVN